MTTPPVLTRLRRANPVTPAVAAESSDLFEQIVALPGDPRLGGRPIRRRGSRRLAVVILALVALAAIASTAYALTEWNGAPPVKPKVTRHEYLQAQHQLTLPPGETWPKLHVPANSVTAPGAGGGRAVLVSQIAWECYWVRAIRTGNVAAGHRAHAELETLFADNVRVAPAGASENWSPRIPPKVPTLYYADDGGYQRDQAMFAAAAAGHPAELIQSCRANS